MTGFTGEGPVCSRSRQQHESWAQELGAGFTLGVTESWPNIDITDAELGLTGYVMFRRYLVGRRGGGVIL